MSILFNWKRKVTEVHTFKLNSGVELNSGGYLKTNENDRIAIIFVDGKLETVNHNADSLDCRSQWAVLGAIDEMIVKLENMYKEDK